MDAIRARIFARAEALLGRIASSEELLEALELLDEAEEAKSRVRAEVRMSHLREGWKTADSARKR